jgi:tRNA(Arg) A34 adenosine deaminase TadA
MNRAFSQVQKVSFSLPNWIREFAKSYTPTKNLAERMQFVVTASRMNVKKRSGGPFAAAIFDSNSGLLVALGVNLVTTQKLSILHAEMVAITLAQRKLRTYDLGGTQIIYELVTSTEPCAMCFGAIPWSGVRRLVTGANQQDARNIGFDEGYKPRRWKEELKKRGIKVVSSVERTEASSVFQIYEISNGHIYNSREAKIHKRP